MQSVVKFIKNYSSILLMIFLAIVIGILLATGVISVQDILSLARGRGKAFTVLVILFLYALKGITGVILFNALVLAVSALFPLGEALVINSAGLIISLTISYLVGRFSKNLTLEGTFQKYPKLAKYFRNAQHEGFIFCLAVHTLNLSLEVQGVLTGLMRIPFWGYLAGSFIAVSPGMICLTIFGCEVSFKNAVAGFQNPALWWVLGVNIALMIFGFTFMKKRVLTTEEKGGTNDVSIVDC